MRSSITGVSNGLRLFYVSVRIPDVRAACETYTDFVHQYVEEAQGLRLPAIHKVDEKNDGNLKYYATGQCVSMNMHWATKSLDDRAWSAYVKCTTAYETCTDFVHPS
jgi:hypothetical protein